LRGSLNGCVTAKVLAWGSWGPRPHFLKGAFSILEARLKGELEQLVKKRRPRFLSPGKPGAGRIFGLKSSSLQAFFFWKGQSGLEHCREREAASKTWDKEA